LRRRGWGSEGPEDVRRRVDAVIKEVVGMQGRWMKERKNGGTDGTTNSVGGREQGCDVLIVAHGHILRAMVKRWLKLEMGSKVEMMLEPGGVCGLSYAHGNVDERAVLVGMSFPQPSS
jgi:sedoheptulose-bisphosphatase